MTGPNVRRIRFVEGKPCQWCGRTKRLATNRKCAFCLFWDACRIIEREVPSTKRESDLAWKTFLDLSRDYRLRETQRRGTHARRARTLEAEGRFTKEQTAAILRMQFGQCSYCSASADLHLDHIIPLARGGSNWPWNLQWLCAHHNMSKGTRTDPEFRAIIGLPADEPIGFVIWREYFRVSMFPILG